MNYQMDPECEIGNISKDVEQNDDFRGARKNDGFFVWGGGAGPPTPPGRAGPPTQNSRAFHQCFATRRFALAFASLRFALLSLRFAFASFRFRIRNR